MSCQTTYLAHCHGCGLITAQSFVTDKDGVAYVCPRCTFRNARLHYVYQTKKSGAWVAHCKDCKLVIA